MTFLVENFVTPIVGATSYTDEVFADAYFVDRGNASWDTATSPAKQVALIKATSYIDKRWITGILGKFPLALDDATQELVFPRQLATARHYVLLQKATAEYALRALTSPLLADPPRAAANNATTEGLQDTTSAAASEVAELSEQVGPIRETTKFRSQSDSLSISGDIDGREIETKTTSEDFIPHYPDADLLMEELVESTHPEGGVQFGFVGR